MSDWSLRDLVWIVVMLLVAFMAYTSGYIRAVTATRRTFLRRDFDARYAALQQASDAAEAAQRKGGRRG